MSEEAPKILSNPEKIGPGIWIFMHIKAVYAQTKELKDQFISDLYILSAEFPCANCRTHIQAYLKNHPFEPYMDLTDETGEQVGMSKWAWQFHNAVNSRLGKPLMEWHTCREMYKKNRELCTECGHKEGSAPVPTVSAKKKEMDTNTRKIITGYFANRDKRGPLGY